MMESGRSEWIQSAWNLIVHGEYDRARELLTSMIEEQDAPLVVPGKINKRWDDIADAEECLAAIDLMTANYRGAVGRAQQAILRSERFRAGAHLLAAQALVKLGDDELAASKLRIVVDLGDVGVAAVALAQLSELGISG